MYNYVDNLSIHLEIIGNLQFNAATIAKSMLNVQIFKNFFFMRVFIVKKLKLFPVLISSTFSSFSLRTPTEATRHYHKSSVNL
jgi:hypothetical protein